MLTGRPACRRSSREHVVYSDRFIPSRALSSRRSFNVLEREAATSESSHFAEREVCLLPRGASSANRRLFCHNPLHAPVSHKERFLIMSDTDCRVTHHVVVGVHLLTLKHTVEVAVLPGLNETSLTDHSQSVVPDVRCCSTWVKAYRNA